MEKVAKGGRWLIGAAFAILLATPGSANAHPLGNFTVNRSSGLEISLNQIVVRYAVDLAEVPTFREFATIDVNRDDAASRSELKTYADAKARFVQDGLRLRVDDTPTRLSILDSDARLSAGEGGLQTMRLDVRFSAVLPRATAVIAYEDLNFSSFPGLKEVIASAVGGQGIVRADVPSVSLTNGLRTYPASALARPPAVTIAQVHVAPGANPAGAPPASPAPSTSARPAGLSSLIERDLGIGSVAVALVLAFGFGAAHAIGPGHGKTVMAAYLIGAGGRARHALGLGLVVSVMHTASVVGLGLLALWLTRSFSPATVYPWLTLTSGVLIVGIGARLFVVRVRARRSGHSHTHATDASPFSKKGLVAIALSGGLVPSPTAVVVLLGSVALHRIAFGVILVVAFSVGLAASLCAIGVAALRARAFAADRWQLGAGSLIPALSSAAVVLAGVVVTVRAAMQLVA